MPDGFALIDKEQGWTSHDVVAKARGMLGERKIGHAGTLDPMATGLLVLGVGRATRLLRFVQGQTKEYETTAMFGVSTDTLDADGAVLSREPMSISEDDVVEVLPRFLGTVLQVPPMVSALKVGGRRLYELAREGIEVERVERPVEIHAIEVTEFAPGPYPEVSLRVRCGAGTYIRTLADDIAGALGGSAHLIALRRTAIGSHRVGDALTLDQFQAAIDGDRDRSPLLTPAAGIADLPSVVVDAEAATAIGYGTVFSATALGLETPGEYAVLDADGTLLSVYVSDGRRAKPIVVMV